jgi:hypothetical protein
VVKNCIHSLALFNIRLDNEVNMTYNSMCINNDKLDKCITSCLPQSIIPRKLICRVIATVSFSHNAVQSCKIHCVVDNEI